MQLLATFLDTSDAPNRPQNESPNRLQNGSEMSPNSDPQEGAKGSPKAMWRQGCHSSPRGGSKRYVSRMPPSGPRKSGSRASQVPELPYYILRMADAATPAATASVRAASVIESQNLRSVQRKLSRLGRGAPKIPWSALSCYFPRYFRRSKSAPK